MTLAAKARERMRTLLSLFSLVPVTHKVSNGALAEEQLQPRRRR